MLFLHSIHAAHIALFVHKCLDLEVLQTHMLFLLWEHILPAIF